MDIIILLLCTTFYFFIILFARFGFKGWSYMSVDSVIMSICNDFFVLPFVIGPVSFMIVVSYISPLLGLSQSFLWGVVVCICIARLGIVLIGSRFNRIPKVWFVSLTLVSISMAYFVQIHAYGSASHIGESSILITLLTVLAVLSVYILFNNSRFGDLGEEDSYHEDIIHLYDKYVKKYSKILPKWYTKNSRQTLILLSIMITEDINRPKIVRIVERIVSIRYPGRSTGIMQVRDDSYLSDKKSIELASKIIKASYLRYSKILSEDYHLVRAVAEDYNGSIYSDIVSDVYFTIKKNKKFDK